MVSIKRALVLSGGGARGAYEVGVWKYLCEKGWRPNLISGTSVGAVNGAAVASGLSVDALVQIWRELEGGKVFRPVSLFRRIANFLLRKGFTPVFDTAPLRKLLDAAIDLERIRENDMELVVQAVDILSSEIGCFRNDEITVDHIMAASAIPLLFPWQLIDGRPHWDAAVMVNTPIRPALDRNAEEIIVVLLSPVGDMSLPVPKTTKEVAERVFEQSMLGSYQALLRSIDEAANGRGAPRIASVAPKDMLGFFSLLNFSKGQSETLIRLGYEDAKEQLDAFLKSDFLKSD